MKLESDQETNDLHSLAEGKEGRQDLHSDGKVGAFPAARLSLAWPAPWSAQPQWEFGSWKVLFSASSWLSCQAWAALSLPRDKANPPRGNSSNGLAQQKSKTKGKTSHYRCANCHRLPARLPTLGGITVMPWCLLVPKLEMAHHLPASLLCATLVWLSHSS